MVRPVVLLTDFGLADAFAGVMKGVILSRCPGAAIIDLTHEIAPQDVRAGAFTLMTSYSYFPKGSIFAAVVDPGVGSARSIVFARARDYFFLAPDNGLLSWIERREPFEEIRQVLNAKLFLEPLSHTFHGRDIFAPVAGELARGLSPQELGPAAPSINRIPFPKPKRSGQKIRGLILAIDRFGNCITTLAAEDAADIRFKKKSFGPLKTRYSAVKTGAALALTGSSGFVELSVRGGCFAKIFKARVGDPVELAV